MNSENYTQVKPVTPAAPYVGGKRLLAKRIIERIDAINHSCYAEPFIGMGGVFLRRTKVPKSEAINDFSSDVAIFFRILQRHYPQFMDTLKFQVSSRENFEKLAAMPAKSLTDLERSARFLYLQKQAFGGQVHGRNFARTLSHGSRFNMNKIGPILEDLHERLASVTIENLDFEKFIKAYDSAGTLFYLDPPYYGVEDYYGTDLFKREDFVRLAKCLVGIKGRFIMSINDKPEIRKMFECFVIEEISTTYSLSGNQNAMPVTELLISGGIGLPPDHKTRRDFMAIEGRYPPFNP